MKNKKTEITITLEDGQKLDMRCGFAGGIMADFTEAPAGLYAGTLDIGDTSLSLTHLLRAVIKANVEQQGMTIEQSKTFIDFCTEQAIKKEIENKNIDNATTDQHETILKNMRRQ